MQYLKENKVPNQGLKQFEAKGLKEQWKSQVLLTKET
jgi:hypothetical protein